MDLEKRKLRISLILQLTKRQVVGRYKGSSLGLLWSFLNPLIMLSIYTFAFSVVFQAKWGIENEGHFDFALVLFASLTLFNLFGDVLREAPFLIVQQPNFVKKVIFPLEILPVVSVFSSLIHSFFSFVIFFFFYFLVNHALPWTVVFLPLVLLPIILIALGLSFFLSSIGVYIRDIGFFMAHFVTILLFTSPVFFSLDKIPLSFRKFLFLNPLSLLLEEGRSILIFERSPNFFVILSTTCFGFLLIYLGFQWFKRTRPGFADVL